VNAFIPILRGEGFFVVTHPSPSRWSRNLNHPDYFRALERKISKMQNVRLSVLALASVLLTLQARAQFADAITEYNVGVGSTPGYTNAAAALGEPSRVIPGLYGGPVTPFNPAYLKSQLVSIGEGGSLTVKFDKAVHNHPRNRFGIDFIIFGNPGFIITNDFDFNTFTWIGTPATDGSLFGGGEGQSIVSVSQDGVNFYRLNPATAPAVDGSLPTDGAGDFTVPVDPTLAPADCAGLTEEQIRALYYGSAGGSGYDLATAQDAFGNRVHLQSISYVRIEVISGKVDVDGVSAVFNPPGNNR
jgi:hypothetical protein